MASLLPPMIDAIYLKFLFGIAINQNKCRVPSIYLQVLHPVYYDCL